MYAIAGGGFIAATLIMARVLDAHTFSQAVLIIALFNVSIAVAPAGLNGVTLRHDLRSDGRLLALGALAAAVVAILAVGAGVFVYQFDMISATVLFAAINAGGIALLARAAFQRAQAFQRIVALHQVANGVFLVAALIMAAGVGRTPWFPVLLVGCWYVVLSVGAWRWIFSHEVDGRPLKLNMWRDAASFGGVALAGEVMMQLERLLLPLTLGNRDLALYAVVAAIALAPYRMLEMGTMSTLTARLRHAAKIHERRVLIMREITVFVTLGVVSGVAIVLIGKYVGKLVNAEVEIPTTLLIAVVISGMVRVLSALSYGAAAAICSGRELHWINVSSWIAVLLGALGGGLLSRLGLEWLVYGVTVGWGWRTVIAAAFAKKYFNTADAGQNTAK